MEAAEFQTLRRTHNTMCGAAILLGTSYIP